MENIQDKKTVKQLALARAVGYIGQHEEPKGSNSGPFVQACLKLVGINFPAAWCMAFVFRCFAEASKEAGAPCPVHKTGGVLDCWNNYDKAEAYAAATVSAHEKPVRMDKIECLHHPELIMPGDQFFLKEGPTIGHTGIVESVDGLFLNTIEGNTNADGSREGYEVCRKRRNMGGQMFLGVVRYV